MNITWEKSGHIYTPSGDGIFKTHVTRPIPDQINEETLRIYFSSRNRDNCPLPTFIDVEINNPKKVIVENQLPLMDFGKIGTFDDSGITPACILNHNDKKLLYYSGWKRRRVTVTLDFSIGLAQIEPNTSSLNRMFEGPILAQDKNHPILTCAPFVLFDDGLYKMWYCSGTEWKHCATGPEPIYRIHYAESDNGIDWKPYDKPAIDYKFAGEVISSPWVIKINNKYHMWYSFRGSATKNDKRYTIGYAHSEDGKKWTRCDESVGIEKSKTGWDSEMICYPSFFSYDDVTYMFYSGNDVGKGGIGYAVAPRFF